MSFDSGIQLELFINPLSQSLSIRTMSFDDVYAELYEKLTNVSIPFDQGDVFRRFSFLLINGGLMGLNPFRSGRCLSTQKR